MDGNNLNPGDNIPNESNHESEKEPSTTNDAIEENVSKQFEESLQIFQPQHEDILLSQNSMNTEKKNVIDSTPVSHEHALNTPHYDWELIKEKSLYPKENKKLEICSDNNVDTSQNIMSAEKNGVFHSPTSVSRHLALNTPQYVPKSITENLIFLEENKKMELCSDNSSQITMNMEQNVDFHSSTSVSQENASQCEPESITENPISPEENTKMEACSGNNEASSENILSTEKNNVFDLSTSVSHEHPLNISQYEWETIKENLKMGVYSDNNEAPSQKKMDKEKNDVFHSSTTVSYDLALNTPQYEPKSITENPISPEENKKMEVCFDNNEVPPQNITSTKKNDVFESSTSISHEHPLNFSQYEPETITENSISSEENQKMEVSSDKNEVSWQNIRNTDGNNVFDSSVPVSHEHAFNTSQYKPETIKENPTSSEKNTKMEVYCDNNETTCRKGNFAVSNVPLIEGQYDVDRISTILKTFQDNCFINSSLVKPEVKMDEEESERINHHETSNQQKEKTIPVISTDLTGVDIENELPCTSIPLKKKPRQRKKVKGEEVKDESEMKSENVDEKPDRLRKVVSKRTTKRKTNYREASSDEEPKFVARSRTRPNNKKNVKTEPTEQKMDPTTTKEITDSPNQFEIKKEDNFVFQPIDLNNKTVTQLDTKMESDMQMPTTSKASASEGEQNVDIDIGEQSLQPSNNEIKQDTTEDEDGVKSKAKLVRNPAASKKRKRKIRTAFSSTTARNKTRLHPLTRQEQQMMNKHMETQLPFLQKIPCLKLSSKISKCRECRCASMRSDSVFCRFYDFRRLRYNEKGVLVLDGFSDPNKDPSPQDIETWMLGPPPKDIDLDISRYILMHVGDQFCRIWQDELTAINEHMSPNKAIAWKKVVKGVREICDVCEATLFNFHWTCSKCGFGVCLDCYKDRKHGRIRKIDRPSKGCDEYGWIQCSMRDPHEMVKLMLTQIIPGNALNFLAHRLHQACKLWKIPQKCGCMLSLNTQADQFAPSCVELADKKIKENYSRYYSRECEIRYLHKIKKLDPENPRDCFLYIEAETDLIEEAKAAGTLPTVLSTTLKHLKLVPKDSSQKVADHLQDEVTKEYNFLLTQKRNQKCLPELIMTLHASQEMFPGIEHDWLCYGKLLRLLDSRDPRNILIFKEFWKRGQPIMVSHLSKFLNIGLWHPEAFCADFGDKKNDLINCMTGNLVPNQPMRLFWEGFQCVSKRLLDANGQPMLLKLKDWPPGDDFAEILPTRFKDLMGALPLPEYTLRTGGLNIASRLPSIFVPPDLGPKMYNAYGSALHPDKGTTNLHLDISDAVNIMVYVGIPTDASAQEQITAALKAIDGGGCDIVTRRRVREPGVMPGALWHIYSARDADKIRDLLNRVTIERGYRLEPDHDPIHDQNWYLDNELRERLYDDYGVEGYPIAQCLGDAVFIPAGAPHQVRNLHNCIKVAEDFVSPENIQHCFHLSQQFRKLSMSHTNHEDKLQIRNVIYHSIKDTTAYLTYLLNQIM